jgi:hypothetical protein
MLNSPLKIHNAYYSFNYDSSLEIEGALSVTGGMTLGGSLTIPSDQSIKIEKVNLNDLELVNTMEDGFIYSYNGVTFLFNSY